MTTSESVVLEAEARAITGKKVRALRRTGMTPIHIYGPGGEPVALQAATDHVRRAVNAAGTTHPVTVRFNGSSALSFVREIARNAVTGELQHVDFLRIDPNRAVDVTVPVVVIGDSVATRGGQANVSQMKRTVHVRALPANLPPKIEADISSLMEIGDSIRVRDLKLPQGVESLDAGNDVIVRITKTRVEEEAPTPEAVAAAEAAAAAGAAPGAAGAPAAPGAPGAAAAAAAAAGKGPAPAAGGRTAAAGAGGKAAAGGAPAAAPAAPAAGAQRGGGRKQ